MTTDTLSTLSQHIATNILRQSKRLIKPDELIISSGLIDSFSLVDLALYIEDTFGVKIDDSELNAQTFDTLAQLVSMIEGRK